MGFAFADVWYSGKEDFRVKNKEGFIKSIYDFEGEVRSGDELEVKVNHHAHA